MRMPFGKHAGLEVSDVPRQYLQWLRRQPNLRGPLVKEIDDVLEDKGVVPTEESFDDILKTWKE